MYTHQQLLDFGKECAESVSEKKIDIDKMGEQFITKLLNQDQGSRSYEQIYPEDIIKVLANMLYGTGITIADGLIQVLQVIDTFCPGERQRIFSIFYKAEIERCKDPEYFFRTWCTITKPNGEKGKLANGFFTEEANRMEDNGIGGICKIPEWRKGIATSLAQAHDGPIAERERGITFIPYDKVTLEKYQPNPTDFDGLVTAFQKTDSLASYIEYGRDSKNIECARFTVHQGQLTSIYVFYREPWKINVQDFYEHIIADRFGPLITIDSNVLNRRFTFWKSKGYRP